MNTSGIQGLNPTEMSEYLSFSIKNNFSTLLVGPPGIGKSDIVEQSCKTNGVKMILTHPVVSDPTDYKGLPFAGKDDDGIDIAKFLPFGDLQELIKTKVPVVFFIDDFGQAAVSVQAALMQLILAGRINGHQLNKKLVTFIAATNSKSDKAGVSGLLEPVKSRFTIQNLEVNVEDWVKWAFANDMPTELIGFIRHRPELLHKFEPTKSITNSPCPRNVSKIGNKQAVGLPKNLELQTFAGDCGEGFAMEYSGFLRLYREMPNIDEIVLNPTKAKVSQEPAIQYALAGALARRMNDQNIESIITYLNRMGAEIGVVTMKDVSVINREVTLTRAFSKWSADNGNLL